MPYEGLSITDVDDAMEMHGDDQTKRRYYTYIRPQLKLTAAERESLYVFGDLDHVSASELNQDEPLTKEEAAP